MKRKKVVLALVVAAVALLIFGGAFCLFRAYDPGIIIQRGTPLNPTYDVVGYRESIGVAETRNSPIPLAKSVEDEMYAFWLWNDEVTSELVEVYSTKPYYVYVSGEREGRTITLRYEGFVTTKEGETIPYHRQASFHLYVRKEDFEL